MNFISISGKTPLECKNYHTLNDRTRNAEAEKSNKCDKLETVRYHWARRSVDWHGVGWYRLMQPAGVVIPEVSPGIVTNIFLV